MLEGFQRFKLEEICRVNRFSRLVETTDGYALCQTDQKPDDGRRILLCAFGRLQFAVVMGGALLTEDGECIEGDALDEVFLLGVVTFFINGSNSFTDDNQVM